MRRQILVDGYNVINKWKSLKDARKKDMAFARVELVNMMRRYSDYTDIDVKVVFDGKGTAPEDNDPMVVFSDKEGSADSSIERMVYKSLDKKNILVVTSDVAEQRMVFGMGGFYLNAEDFEKHLLDVLKDESVEMEHMSRKIRLGNNPKVVKKNA